MKHSMQNNVYYHCKALLLLFCLMCVPYVCGFASNSDKSKNCAEECGAQYKLKP